jgi:GNAT superfamily N-acetyltransferase
MTQDYEIVPYRPEFKRQVVELQAHLWGPDLAVNAAHLEWKYERNPYVETPLIYLALHRGQVVGMRGLYGAQWQIGQPCQKWFGLCAGDLVIAPEHRNHGLFTQIMRAAFNDAAGRGHAFIFNLSAGRVTYLGSLAMGWRGIGRLQTMRRRGDAGSAEESFQRLDRYGARRWRVAGTHLSVGQAPRPEAMADLVERLGSNGRIRHVRDQQYFAWRFQNPLSVYRFLFWEEGRLEGYLVMRRSVYADRPRVDIADWEATNDHIRADLLKAAIQWGHFQDLTIWSATLLDEAQTVLRHHGFTPVHAAGPIARDLPTVLVRPADDGRLEADWVLADRRLLDVENWDLRMIYSDGC